MNFNGTCCRVTGGPLARRVTTTTSFVAPWSVLRRANSKCAAKRPVSQCGEAAEITLCVTSMTPEINATLARIEQSQDELLGLSQQTRKKDFWNVFGILSGVLSAILVGLIGYLTWHESHIRGEEEGARKRLEVKVSEAQMIGSLVPHLAGSEATKKLALLVISTFGDSDFVAKFSQLDQSAGSRAAGDIVMARGEESKPSSGTADRPGIGWAYIGTFDQSKRRWETQYFKFDPSLPPEQLRGRSLLVNDVTGSLNVRRGLPDT